jgi:ABC-type transporter Mla subunit MlaD
MKDNSSGITGILGIAVCVALFLAARKFFPSLATLMLWLVGIAGVVIVVLIGLVIYFSVTGNKEKNDPDSPAAILSKARANLMELRRMQVEIKNREIANLCRELTDIGDKILSALKQNQEAVSDARQFLNYYLPTLGKILTSYVRLEESGSMTEELRNSTVTHLGEIKKAMEKQYNSLFDDDKLDLTVDMEALTLACRRDGLLEKEEGENT